MYKPSLEEHKNITLQYCQLQIIHTDNRELFISSVFKTFFMCKLLLSPHFDPRKLHLNIAYLTDNMAKMYKKKYKMHLK